MSSSRTIWASGMLSLTCLAFAAFRMFTAPDRIEVILVGAACIAASYLVTVPALSGTSLYLSLGVATATPFLITDGPSLLATLMLGVGIGWGIILVSVPNIEEAGSRFLEEVVAMLAFGVVVIGAGRIMPTSGSADHATSLQIAAVAAVAWFVVRAAMRAIRGLERGALSSRFLWLQALGDWSVTVGLFTFGALFGLAFPLVRWWAIPLATLPYGLSHLALVRYNSTRITYGQMIRALAEIPEVAGLTHKGHSKRTAELALSIAIDMGLHPDEGIEIEYAALMHDIGRITLNEPAILRAGYTNEDIGRWGAQIIAEAPYLDRVGELVREQHRPYRTANGERDNELALASKIIKVASAYDHAIHVTQLSSTDALELLHLGSTYDYDPDVTVVLRRIVEVDEAPAALRVGG